MPSKAQVKASWSRASTIRPGPYLVPLRDPSTRCGALVIDSNPPATTTSCCPRRMSWSAYAIADNPDRHSLFSVVAGTSKPMPPCTAAIRAGLGPTPAWTTLPMITASTSVAGMAERVRASRIAMAPRLVALRPDRLPKRRPMGVRAPAMITELVPISPMGRRRAFASGSGSTDKRTFPLELLAGDRATVDGVGTVDNTQAPGPRIEVRERRVVADTRTAEHLDRPVDHRDSHRWCGDLDRRDLGARALGPVLVDQPCRLVHQQPGLVDVDSGLRDQLLHRALLGQVLAERHPRLRTIHHEPQRTFGHADSAHRVVNSARLG